MSAAVASLNGTRLLGLEAGETVFLRLSSMVGSEDPQIKGGTGRGTGPSAGCSPLQGCRDLVPLAHDRRRILHVGVTAHPTAEWTAQQLHEAFPWETAPRYLLRDRDGIFGPHVRGSGQSHGDVRGFIDAWVALAARLHRTPHRHDPS